MLRRKSREEKRECGLLFYIYSVIKEGFTEVTFVPKSKGNEKDMQLPGKCVIQAGGTVSKS